MKISNQKLKELLRQGRIEEAIRELETIIKKNTRDYASRYLLGEIYYSLGEFSKAEEQYFFCLKNNFNLVDTYYNIGILYKEQRKFEQALKYLNLVIKENSADVETLNHIGECFFHLGYYKEAEAVFSKAEEIDPGFVLPQYNLGFYYYSFSEYKKALKKLEKVLDIEPEFENALNILGKIKNEIRQKSETKKIQSRPRLGFVSIWFERGQSYVTRALRDVLRNDFDTCVFARMGGVNGTKMQKREKNWNDPDITYFNDYKIPPAVLKDWIVTHNLDAVIFNEEYDWDLVYACRQHGVKTLTYMDYYKEEWDSFLALYDGILCSTRRSYDMVKDKAKAYFIGWGVDTDLFRPAGRGEKKFTFFHNAGWAGINFRKMTPAVVLAFNAISKTRNNMNLLIHSQIPLEKYPKFMQIIVKSNGTIEFRCETVPHPGLYHLGEIYVYPTKLEGLGLTVVEALSCGLPVITTDAPPMNEFVIDGYNGLLVKVAKEVTRFDNIAFPETLVSINDLAVKMDFMAQEKKIREKMGKNARKMILKEYDWNKKQKEISGMMMNIVREDVKEKESVYENSLC